LTANVFRIKYTTNVQNATVDPRMEIQVAILAISGFILLSPAAGTTIESEQELFSLIIEVRTVCNGLESLFGDIVVNHNIN
jgi:hypothetical protein